MSITPREIINEMRVFGCLFTKLIEPARYRLKIYYISIFLFIEYCTVCLVVNDNKSNNPGYNLKKAIILNDYYKRIVFILKKIHEKIAHGNGKFYLNSYYLQKEAIF